MGSQGVFICRDPQHQRHFELERLDDGFQSQGVKFGGRRGLQNARNKILYRLEPHELAVDAVFGAVEVALDDEVAAAFGLEPFADRQQFLVAPLILGLRHTRMEML